jgi:exodeoxyribonuclease VII large subunit
MPRAQIRCATVPRRSRGGSFMPANGMQVLARGRVSLYEPRGDYQLIVDHLEPAGEGLLRRRLEELKQKLAAGGLFDAARKRPLPALPGAIGVVTSPSGAAVRDILHVLKRRFPAMPVIIYPCRCRASRRSRHRQGLRNSGATAGPSATY